MGVAKVPPALPLPLPQKTPSWELFPVRQGPVLPGVLVLEEQEAEGHKSARLAEEIQAAARRAAESAEVG